MDWCGPNGYPSEVAGCEQLDRRVKGWDELVAQGWHEQVVTVPVLPVSGPVAVRMGRDGREAGWSGRTLCDGRFAHKGGQDAADMDLEMAANALLAFHYGDAMTLDVMREVTRPDGVTSGWDSVVKADRAAHRGKARYQVRSHRYGGNGCFTVDGSGQVTDTRAITYVLGQPLRFVGLVAVRGTKQDHQERARTQARQAQRVGSLGKRGKAVTSMDAGASTIRRVWGKADQTQVATAEQIEAILRTSTTGSTVSLDASHQVTVHESTIIDADGRSFTIREYARRAALAGCAID